MGNRPLGDLPRAEFERVIGARRRTRMEAVDNLPADIRACVHDYGLAIVTACLDLKITKARHIRHLIETTLDEFSPTRGSNAAQGVRHIREVA